MIGSLTGRLQEKSPSEILLDVGGVGYRVFVPLTTFGRLPAPGAHLTLSIHTHVRDDALALYGFDTPVERDVFEEMISVPGVGPRLALAVLSHMDPADLIESVRRRDADAFVRVPGIGRKTAERLVLELGSAMKRFPAIEAGGPSAPGAGRRGDLVSALENLGYRAPQIASAVESVLSRAGDDEPLESLLRSALREIASPSRSASTRPHLPAAAAVQDSPDAGRRRST